MERREWILICIIAGCALALCVHLFWPSGKKVADCHPRLVEKGRMNDAWLAGALDQGREFEALHGWFDCLPVQRGDLVLFHPSSGGSPVVRQVQGVQGDRFKLTRSPDNSRWSIEINGDPLKVGENIYYFGSSGTPALALYEKAHGGVLDQNSVLLFSTVMPGDSDSASLGVISTSDILAKVVPK